MVNTTWDVCSVRNTLLLPIVDESGKRSCAHTCVHDTVWRASTRAVLHALGILYTVMGVSTVGTSLVARAALAMCVDRVLVTKASANEQVQ
jgi:hypothetical protein